MSIDAINAALKDPAPQMPGPLPSDVELIRGLQSTDGVWVKNAVARELNGEDEEFLVGIGNATDIMYTEYMTHVLVRGVVSIGGQPVDKDMLSLLIIPDRELLYHAIIKMTYGRTKEVRMPCRHCGHVGDYELDLDEDFPIKRPDTDLTQPFSVTLSGGEVEINVPTAFDIENATKKLGKVSNTALHNTHLMAYCLVSDGTKDHDDTVEFVRSLSLGDRKKLERAISESLSDIGPQLREVNARCSNCDEPIAVLMDWVSLLLG